MLNKKSGLILLVLTLILTASCKKEFTEIGVNLIGKPHFDGKIYETNQIKIYDQAIPKVLSMATNGIPQSHIPEMSNLPITSLGIYNDDKFGKLNANIISTIEYNPNLRNDLGENIKLLDAKLIIPYFSHIKIENSQKKYLLDSIFGDNPINIKIYESTYFLPTYDPNNNLEELKYFYSNFDFTNYKAGIIGDTINFVTNNTPYYIYKRNDDGSVILDDNGNPEIKDSLGPHLTIKLDTTFFRHKIFDHSSETILTNKFEFKDYFRGIIIEAEGNNTQYIQFPFEKAKILIDYTNETLDDNGTPSDTTDDTTKIIFHELTFNLGKTRINYYQNTLTGYAQNALNNSDLINGDNEIILKGDAGAEGVIKLFSEQELRDLRLKNWLINYAELYLYVDQTQTDQMLAQSERLILYNYDDKKSLPDLYAPENNQSNNYAIFDGTLHTDENGQSYYKFSITRHIRNVINRDSTNVRLGLRVCNGINLPLKTNTVFRDPDAYTPKGVILYGNQAVQPTQKPVLKLYYTKPE